MDFNSSLTNGKPTADPLAADGEPNGATTPRDPEALPCAPDAPVAEPRAPAPTSDVLGASAAIQAALTGEPGTLPATWCKKCAADVLPVGKGRCPRCNSFLKLNFSARKHPVNKLRKQQLLDKLDVDYQPSTTILHSTCETLAGILEQLETMRPGSPDHQRLVQLSQVLAAALEAARPTRGEHDLADLTHEQLIDRTTALLRSMLDGRDNEQRKGDVRLHDHTPSHFDTSPVVDAAGLPVPPPAPAPEPPCPYCHRKCVGPEHSAYDVMHWNDPEERKKRDEKATAEMFESMRRERTGGTPRW